MIESNYVALYLVIVQGFVLAAIFYFVYKAFPVMRQGKIPLFYWIILLLVLLAGFQIRMAIPHYHFLYTDDWYPLQMANKIVGLDLNAVNLPNFISNALVFVPGFLIFGVSDNCAFITMIIIGELSIVILFLLAASITGRPLAGAIAAILMSFNIVHISYSLSTYNHIPTLLFALLTLYSFFLYLKTGKKETLYLSLFAYAFTVYLRMEFILLGLLLVPLYLARHRKRLLRLRTYLPLIILGILLLLSFPKYAAYIEIQENQPLDTSVANLGYNLHHNVIPFFELNIIYISLIIIGLAAALIDKKYYALYFFVVSGLFALIYLMLEPAHLTIGRHFSLTVASLYVLLGYGVSRLVSIVKKNRMRAILSVAVLVLLFAFSYHNAYKYKEDQLNEGYVKRFYFATILPEKLQDIIPHNCTIISNHPARFSATTVFDSVSADDFIKPEDDHRCYVFVDDISCVYPTEKSKTMCQDFVDNNKLVFFRKITSTELGIQSQTVYNATLYWVG